MLLITGAGVLRSGGLREAIGGMLLITGAGVLRSGG